VVKRAAALLTVISATACGSVAAAARAVPAPWQNCAHVNKKYPHGVGRGNAKDKTSGTPVTAFKRNTRLYRIAIKNNGSLDRDRDGIACEAQ
jgi:hypothetical protein